MRSRTVTGEFGYHAICMMCGAEGAMPHKHSQADGPSRIEALERETKKRLGESAGQVSTEG
jgi:hypothetical protein